MNLWIETPSSGVEVFHLKDGSQKVWYVPETQAEPSFGGFVRRIARSSQDTPQMQEAPKKG